MSRDAGGNYTLPAGNPVAPNTVIESNWANPTMSDIAVALTDSLSRSGLGGMLVPFKNADGTIAAPGMSWANEPSSGWYRKTANEFWYSVAAQDVFGITAAGITLAPGKTATGISSFINVADTQPVTLIQGEQWYESDSALLAMRYVNPDLTQTLVSLAASGGDFVPYAQRATANGVATLDATVKVPLAQIPDLSATYIPSADEGVPNGVATLDAAGRVPVAQGGAVTGEIKAYAGATPPAGYLLCDGASYTTAAQVALFAAIGYVWGGAGANFNVPDLRRRTMIGIGGAAVSGPAATLGAVGGAETHTLTEAEIPAHVHGAVLNNLAGSSAIPGTGFNQGTTAAAGGGGAHNTMQPSAVVNYIIKT